ncbi:hypothetical protein BX666DRAFT_972880 [Dichotomocladium elegans]|nr:hypothetical protein BX666DRAFT_972880 [Dichotomocladium elegans]
MTRINQSRRITGQQKILPKVPSIRPDLVLLKDGIEYGVGECGKMNPSEVGKKEIVETQLHVPKVAKDMLVRALAMGGNTVELLRSIRIPCFLQSHLCMHTAFLDSPDGYVCRIVSSESYEISPWVTMMGSGLLPLLKLTLKSKEVVRATMRAVKLSLVRRGREDPGFPGTIGNADSVGLPPCMHFSKKLKTDNLSQ